MNKQSKSEVTPAGNKFLTLTIDNVIVSVTRNPQFPDSADVFVIFFQDGEYKSEAETLIQGGFLVEPVSIQSLIGRDHAVFLITDTLAAPLMKDKSDEEMGDVYQEADDFVTHCFNSTF